MYDHVILRMNSHDGTLWSCAADRKATPPRISILSGEAISSDTIQQQPQIATARSTDLRRTKFLYRHWLHNPNGSCILSMQNDADGSRKSFGNVWILYEIC